MKRNSFKKLLALLTVLVMTLGVVAVPNTVALATWDSELQAYNCVNTWWGGANNIVCYVAESGTVGEMETSKGNHPGDTGFAYWKSIILELQDNGTYLVKEIIPADGSNTKLDIALTTGRLVINYHADSATKQDWVAFYDSLKVGDALYADISYEAIAAVSEVATFTKATTQGAINVINGFGEYSEDGNSAYDICALAVADANVTVGAAVESVNPGGLNWWYSMVLQYNAEKGTWVVKAADLVADGICSIADEKLGEGIMVVGVHGGARDTDSAAFYKGTAKVGQEYYLVGEIPATTPSLEGTRLNGVYFTTEKPAEQEGTEPEDTNQEDTKQEETINKAGDFNTMGTTTLMMVSVALVSVVLVLKKRNNVA